MVQLLPLLLALAAVPLHAHAWWKPTPGTSYQIQLNGDLDLSYNVSMYDIDLFDTPAETIAQLQKRGIKVVCYFSAGTYENWRPDKDAFSKGMYGKGLPDWKGEYYVDTRNPKVRAIMTTRLQMAKDKGCDGVDPDNVDAWDTDSGFPLTEATQLDYNIFLADSAHALNMSVGLKNDIKQTTALVDHFDFAVNEECIEFKTCDDTKLFVTKNKPVFSIEYKGNRAAGCAQANAMNLDTLYKSLELKTDRFSCRDSATNANGTAPTEAAPTPASGTSSVLSSAVGVVVLTVVALVTTT